MNEGKQEVNNMHKKDIIKLLETIAIYMELKGDNPFKISAFRKARRLLNKTTGASRKSMI